MGSRREAQPAYRQGAARRTGHAEEVLKYDMLVAARAAGLDLINVTVKELQAHLDEFGLPQNMVRTVRYEGYQGVEEVKLVLAAAMWNETSPVDSGRADELLRSRDSLGALSNAIRDFGGGVVMISHAEEFYKPLCSEQWLVEAGKLTCDGEAEDKKLKIGKKKREAKVKEEVKTTGSINEEVKYQNPKDFWGKNLSKKTSGPGRRRSRNGIIPRCANYSACPRARPRRACPRGSRTGCHGQWRGELAERSDDDGRGRFRGAMRR